MSEYNWCHNPKCHTIETQSRVRGSGDNKVLRTIKIKQERKYHSIFNYFCNNSCLFAFLNKFTKEIANIRPVREPRETPIIIEKEKYESHRYRYGANGSTREPYMATRTTIKLDNSEG